MNELRSPDVIAPLLIVSWFFRELLGHVFRLRRAFGGRLFETAPDPIEKKDFLIAASVAVCFYLLCLWRLGAPDQQYFDEVHHVRTAAEYMHGLDPHEWTHPPLAKLIMAVSMKWAGAEMDPRDGIWNAENRYPLRTVISWRFPSVCFGALALCALYALARTLFESRRIALTATLLLAVDGVFFVQSRIGMTNIYVVCFIITGTLGTWLYLKWADRRYLLLTGIALGLALATRWTSLWAWGLNGLLLVWNLFHQEAPRWRRQRKNANREFAVWVSTVTATMVLLPLSLYFLSYVPFVLQGPGDLRTKLFTSGEPQTADWSRVFAREHYAAGHGWYKVINQQKDMWNYHAEIKEPHPYSSPWWSWPLLLRPTWYHFDSDKGVNTSVWAIGNAVIWWASVPALLCLLYLATLHRSLPLSVVSLLGFGMWLCWAIKPRPLIFMHYYFECIPFVCIALAFLGCKLWDTGEESARLFVGSVAVLAVLWFLFYYPMLSALPILDWFFRMHIWMDRIWI